MRFGMRRPRVACGSRAERQRGRVCADGAVAGRPKEAPTAYLANLYVEPSLFRQRIGSRLLHFVERELIATGFRSVVAWVVEDAPAAQSFYAAQGWKPTGRVKDLLLDRSRLVRLWQKMLTLE